MKTCPLLENHQIRVRLHIERNNRYWIAWIPALGISTCSASGNTPHDSVEQLNKIAWDMLDSLKEKELKLPEADQPWQSPSIQYYISSNKKKTGNKTERIKSAAIVHNGIVYAMAPPARHHNIIHLVYNRTGEKINGAQGFLTTSNRFVDREEARRIATKSGQCEKTIHKTKLFSEDLW